MKRRRFTCQSKEVVCNPSTRSKLGTMLMLFDHEDTFLKAESCRPRSSLPATRGQQGEVAEKFVEDIKSKARPRVLGPFVHDTKQSHAFILSSCTARAAKDQTKCTIPTLQQGQVYSTQPVTSLSHPGMFIPVHFEA